MNNLDKDIKASGIVMGGEYDENTHNYFWAEITPSSGKLYRWLLPSVRRWWFEVHETEQKPSDELKIGQITHAYEKYGSGGAYTLRGCMIKAQLALEEATRCEG